MSREQQERREKWERDPVRVDALANHQAKSKAVDQVKYPHLWMGCCCVHFVCECLYMHVHA